MSPDHPGKEVNRQWRRWAIWEFVPKPAGGWKKLGLQQMPIYNASSNTSFGDLLVFIQAWLPLPNAGWEGIRQSTPNPFVLSNLAVSILRYAIFQSTRRTALHQR